MYAIPTTTVTILGGAETTDDLGDLVSGETVTASGVPCSLLEQTRRITSKSDQRVQVVTFVTARLPGDAVVTLTDRLRDEATGVVYFVESVTRVGSPVTVNDLRLDLRKASS